MTEAARVAALLGLVAANAFFVAAEYAIVTARRAPLTITTASSLHGRVTRIVAHRLARAAARSVVVQWQRLWSVGMR